MTKKKRLYKRTSKKVSSRSSRKRLRIRKKKPFFKHKSFWIFCFCLLLLAGLFYLLFFSRLFQVKEIEILGSHKVEDQRLLELINPLIEKKLVFGNRTLLETKSIFLVKSKELKNIILENLAEIDEVSPRKKFPHSLVLGIKERESSVIVCFSEERCFETDKKGVVFKESDKKQGLVVYLEEGGDISFGERIIEPRDLEFILQIDGNLSSDPRIEIKKLFLFKKRLNVETEEGFEVYFDLGKNPADQLFNLDLVLKEEMSEEKLKALEYIDLRFGSKVFYK